MRIVSYIVVVAVVSALAIGAAVLVLASMPTATTAMRLAAGLATLLLIDGPLVLASVVLDGGPDVARWRLGVVALDVVLAGALIWAAIGSGASVLLPVVVVIGAGVLVGAAGPLAAPFRRTAPERRAPWMPIEQAEIRRRLRPIGLTFLVAAVSVGVAGTVAVASTSSATDDVVDSVFPVGAVAPLAAAVAGLIASASLSETFDVTTGWDAGRRRRFFRVVVLGRALQLDEQEEKGALQYASIAPTVLGVQVGQNALFAAGMSGPVLDQVRDGNLTILSTVAFIIWIGLLAYQIPRTFRGIARARTYEREHAPLLVDPS